MTMLRLFDKTFSQLQNFTFYLDSTIIYKFSPLAHKRVYAVLVKFYITGSCSPVFLLATMRFLSEKYGLKNPYFKNMDEHDEVIFHSGLPLKSLTHLLNIVDDDCQRSYLLFGRIRSYEKCWLMFMSANKFSDII